MTKPKNYVAIVLDRSGSMHSIRHETIQAFNGMVDEIRERSAQEGQDTAVTFVTFANQARVEFFNADSKTLRPLTPASYVPDGMTALFDGVGETIKSFQAVRDANDQNVSFLVLVVTDGGENSSEVYVAADIAKMLRETQATDRWSFVFQVPHGHAKGFIDRFGIPADNVREWAATPEGSKEVELSTRSGLTGYFGARARGMSSTKSFYDGAKR